MSIRFRLFILSAVLVAACCVSFLAFAETSKEKGYVYIISNVGSFGEDVYKIGLTKRKEPMDRVAELNDASVPFPFDVHAMIPCSRARELELELHRAFVDNRVNLVSAKKEFFRMPLADIRAKVEELSDKYDLPKVEWTAVPEASAYRESIDIALDIKLNPSAGWEWKDRLNREDQLHEDE